MPKPSLLPHYYKGLVEAGCDEAGRGCLAGPVFAAAVILPPDYDHPGLNDSKKLSLAARRRLRQDIERDALAWAVAQCSPDEIDRFNILQASIIAMHRAVDALTVRPQALIVDGNRFRPYRDLPFTTIVKGDGLYQPIAAAAILAKTHRDDYMEQLAIEHPEYGWQTNMGYPTHAHREAIRLYGPTPHHRKSFTLLPPRQLTLPFQP